VPPAPTDLLTRIVGGQEAETVTASPAWPKSGGEGCAEFEPVDRLRPLPHRLRSVPPGLWIGR